MTPPSLRWEKFAAFWGIAAVVTFGAYRLVHYLIRDTGYIGWCRVVSSEFGRECPMTDWNSILRRVLLVPLILGGAYLLGLFRRKLGSWPRAIGLTAGALVILWIVGFIVDASIAGYL